MRFSSRLWTWIAAPWNVARNVRGLGTSLARLQAAVDAGFKSTDASSKQMLHSHTSKLSREISQGVKNLENSLYQQLTAYLELRHAMDEPHRIAPLRGYAASPDLLLLLLDLLERYQPKRILEFGSGFSSVVLARYASKSNARVVSVDHDLDYGATSRRLVEDWGYAKVHDLVLAKVLPQAGVLFYDLEKVAAKGGRFDFVFLDGPPQKLGLTVRQGLLPLFEGLFSPGCIIVLDDYQRPGEREAVANWVRDGFVEVLDENRRVEKHAAVLRSKVGC